MPTRLAAAFAATAAVLATLTGPGPVASAAPAPIAKSSVIDDYAGYEPQTSCRSTPLPGTQRLHSWLLSSNPGTTSMGMIRGCSVGGSSEHKDGRGIDWGVDVRTAWGKATAYRTINKLLATDKFGNKAALARRMGIMYWIYDDKIWSSYRGFEPRAYTHYGCSQISGCSPTLRHQDHVHFSLSRAGGSAQTSWYRNQRVPAVPVLEPGTNILDTDSTAVVSFTVPANGTRVGTPFRLPGGHSYKVVADGTVGLGTGPADAACVTGKGGAWVRTDRQGAGLLVNGRKVWQTPCVGEEDASVPAVAPHTHLGESRLHKTRRMFFQFTDATPGNNTGSIRVHLIRDDIRPGSLATQR